MYTEQDVITYRLVAYKTLPQDTVKITVSITMLAGANQTDQNSLQIRIRDALARFIPKCNWVFSVLNRDTHTVAGYERINLEAAARVPSAQNYNLFRRAQLASIEGLSIGNPSVDYDLPTRIVDGVVADLRKQILREALNEAQRYSSITNRYWRIGEIHFGENNDYHRATAKGATRQAGSEGLEVDDVVDGLSGAQQIGLNASVTLRAYPEKQDQHLEHFTCIK